MYKENKSRLFRQFVTSVRKKLWDCINFIIIPFTWAFKKLFNSHFLLHKGTENWAEDFSIILVPLKNVLVTTIMVNGVTNVRLSNSGIYLLRCDLDFKGSTLSLTYKNIIKYACGL